MPSDIDLNGALDVVLAWGPERNRPVLVRLKERFPGCSDRELLEVETICDAIGSCGVRLADEIGDRDMTGDQALRILSERWPGLDADHAWRALWQGFYSYWRDSGRFPEEPAPARRRPRKK
ncbi:hypothetical protein [Bradyrhizobium sp.]|uniref:hypothetical protein n=1 Tax=Bradyrhizobium sp. TaxID=376 RepID=UPI001E0FEBC0|nr:hypothetical protein [Bradyrhizobium sp.]MBI5321989.1 hypothetical protein [Bradyrhizobium sp.]